MQNLRLRDKVDVHPAADCQIAAHQVMPLVGFRGETFDLSCWLYFPVRAEVAAHFRSGTAEPAFLTECDRGRYGGAGQDWPWPRQEKCRPSAIARPSMSSGARIDMPGRPLRRKCVDPSTGVHATRVACSDSRRGPPRVVPDDRNRDTPGQHPRATSRRGADEKSNTVATGKLRRLERDRRNNNGTPRRRPRPRQVEDAAQLLGRMKDKRTHRRERSPLGNGCRRRSSRK